MTKSLAWFNCFKEKMQLETDLAELENIDLQEQLVPMSWPMRQARKRDRVAMMGRKTKQIAEIKKFMAKATGRTAEEASPITWLSTAREFGDWIIRAYDQGQLKATSRMDALRKVAGHFVSKEGKRFDPRSVWQNRKNREDYENPSKPGPK